MRLEQSAKRLLLVVAFTASVCGCRSGDGEVSGSSCPQEFVYQGKTYDAVKAESRVAGTRSIGHVSYTDCMTSGISGDKEASNVRIPAYAIKGIDPSVAFVVRGQRRCVGTERRV